MHDMLPRKPTTAVPDIKKGYKDSLFGNGMNSTSPALISPAPSGGSTSPSQDGNDGMALKSNSGSPQVMLKNNEEKLLNSSPNCMPSMMPKPLTSSVATASIASPLSSPGIGRTKTPPKSKVRRNQSTDLKQKNQIFNFEENNFCANNNNNSKQQNDKLSLQQRRLKSDEQSRTPSRNSISDELSSSSLTPTTDEQTNSVPAGQLDSIFDVSEEMLDKVLNETSPLGNLFPDAAGLADLDLFENTGSNLRTSTGDLLDGNLLNNLKDSSPAHPSTTVPPSSGPGQTSARPSSASSPSFHNDSATPDRKKSHLQDILGVTDTNKLKNMSRPIDSFPYKSPTTTTSFSTGVKPTLTPPCTMAPPSRLPNIPLSPFNKPRQQFMFENAGFRPQGFMDNGVNGPWNRGSPRNGHPNMMKSPQFSAPFAENPSISPSNVNPMSGLQNTVDSIPAAPPSEPGTPVMGPPLRSPLSIDATASPGGGKMRPPPSPSVANNDKRCVSADPVSNSNGKKSGNKRERTRSADSKDEDKKETSGPKNKRRKSRSKDENNPGKKSESKTPGRNSSKDEKLLRPDSVLTGLLDVPTNNPYIYIFNTDVANKAAENVNSNNVTDIILFHQSFMGNQTLQPSQHFKPKTTTPALIPRPTTIPDPMSMSMPTTSRSPTEITLEKPDLMQKSPKIEPPQSIPDTLHVNLQDTKPSMLPPPVCDIKPMIPDIISSQPMPITSQNGNQEELSAEKRRQRDSKLDKIRQMQESFRMHENQGEHVSIVGNHVHRPPGWPGHPGAVHYGVPPRMPKGMRPDMKEMPDGMMHHHPQQIMPESSEQWQHLVQAHNARKQRRQEGELPSRPPPPYDMNGPRWAGPPDMIPMDHRMPVEHMNHPRLQRIPSGPRPMLRMAQDPARMPGAYMRMGLHRGPYPTQPNQPPQQRMPVYEQYMGPAMRHPTRIPHPRPGTSENYPFSEQLMKQASYYRNSNVPPYDSEPGPEWNGPEGPQRLMPGTSPSPAMQPQGMINPMEMNSRPGMPLNRGFEPHMVAQYNPEMGHPQRYDMIPPMGSPTGPMDARMRGPAVGSMMDAIARRGSQRPPDLNLNSQIPPRSPMNTLNYHGPAPMPSPNVMPGPVGPRYSNPGEMGHPPQPSPMQASPMGMGHPMGPSSAGIDHPPQVMMAPHSAGPHSNPPPNDWPGPNHNMSGTPTPNSNMMHHIMTSQPGGMTSQPGMMPSQMMNPHPPGMMSPPTMMSQPGMPVIMTSQNLRMPNAPAGKHGQSTISIMMDRMNTFKMPEKSPLYQDAVKDTASPPIGHPNDAPPHGHAPMPGAPRMPGHPPNYDARMVHRMPGPHINESYPGYPPGHPSPMSGRPMPGGNGGMMMNIVGEPMPPPSDYQQPPHRSNFPEMEFDLRNILPSERPSQTISYLPPENNTDQFSSPGWDGIRPQLMPGPTHPGRPLL